MIAQSVAEIISRVRLTVEGIDRMYLNVFVPDLQYEQGIVHFFRTHRGCGGRVLEKIWPADFRLGSFALLIRFSHVRFAPIAISWHPRYPSNDA